MEPSRNQEASDKLIVSKILMLCSILILSTNSNSKQVHSYIARSMDLRHARRYFYYIDVLYIVR